MEKNPDKGFGKPGSLQWHSLYIDQCKTHGEVLDYLICVVSEPHSLAEAKNLAIIEIERFLNGKRK